MKRISRRNFLKVAGVGAAALGLAACGGSSSSTASSAASSAATSAAAENVTIKVAAIETGYGAEMWKKVTEAFTAQTGIKVDLTTDKKLEDVIGPSMQGGDYPDVVHLATGREAALTEQFIKGNLIADITDVLSMTVPGESKKVSEKIAGGFTDTSLTNPYGDGKTYLAPMFYSPCGLFYNAGFLKEKGWEVPTTWDEMVDTCSKIREITGAPAFGWDNLAGSFMTLVKQFGGRYTDQNGNIYFANEDADVALKVLNLWKDNVDRGIWRTAGEDMFFSGPFANQQVQMYLSSGNEGEFINMKIPESAKFEWSCAPIPQFEDGTKADYAEGFLISMLDNTNDLATRWASWIFIQYMQSYEVCQKINSGESRLPFLKSVAASDEFLNSAAPAQLAGVEQQDFAYTYPGFETDTYTSSGLHDYVVIAMDNILNNGADVRTELEKLISTLQ